MLLIYYILPSERTTMASQAQTEEPMDWHESVYEEDMEVDVVHQPPTTSEYKVVCRVIKTEIQRKHDKANQHCDSSFPS